MTQTSIKDLPKQLQGLVEQTVRLFGGACIARVILTLRKVCLSIFCSVIWFNFARIKNQKKYFWFVCKFKLKVVFIVYWIKFFFTFIVRTILLPAETVSVTLVCHPYLYFEPHIFSSSNRKHQIGDAWTVFYGSKLHGKNCIYVGYIFMHFLMFLNFLLKKVKHSFQYQSVIKKILKLTIIRK